MIMREESAVLAASTLTNEEASTLPISALTAWYSFVTFGNLQKGDSVLIHCSY
jgi:NADPH:quinone reductase-like Zn-dependent oxidoreductase